MQPGFDQQAREMMHSVFAGAHFALDAYIDPETDRFVLTHGADHDWILQSKVEEFTTALRAAYRAGMEHAAQIADGCCYGREAASKIREEIE